MKKVKLIIALLMCLVSSISFGQSFSITPTGLMNSEILTDDFVIINIENNKSSSEIYNNLMSYITTTYVNGNKNADSKTIENEYIDLILIYQKYLN
ncbi:hypothetical protein M0Q50_07275 [bacterium]|jgi:hypothetical protein|nr:hypothetical protein [bacterium]